MNFPSSVTCHVSLMPAHLAQVCVFIWPPLLGWGAGDQRCPQKYRLFCSPWTILFSRCSLSPSITAAYPGILLAANVGWVSTSSAGPGEADCVYRGPCPERTPGSGHHTQDVCIHRTKYVMGSLGWVQVRRWGSRAFENLEGRVFTRHCRGQQCLHRGVSWDFSRAL